MKDLSDREYEQYKADVYNSNQGTNSDNSSLFDLYDCNECKNKFVVAFVNSYDEFALKPCKCVKIRKTLKNISESGLTEELKSKTFESYNAAESWQKTCKNTALKYIDDNSRAWLFAGGQSGAGKTHLCTAICNVMLKRGLTVKYILWRRIVQKLDANRFNDENYQKILDDISKADILYIDDFLKSTDPKKEINHAFEIINTRDTADKRTIISSELLIDDIKKLDEALAGRIAHHAKNFKIQISKSIDRNYRLKRKNIR